MKRLILLLCGLTSAFSVMAGNIYNEAVSFVPKVEENWVVNSCPNRPEIKTVEACRYHLTEVFHNNYDGPEECPPPGHGSGYAILDEQVTQLTDTYISYRFVADRYFCHTTNLSGSTVFGSFTSKKITDKSCPPAGNSQYTFARDMTGNGEIDACFNPDALDDASNCAERFNAGILLPASSSGAPSTVCHSNPDTGQSCAYSLQHTASTSFYQGNLEQSCFGDGEPVPDYNDPNYPNPQQEQCNPYGGGFVCAADPANRCDAQGVCEDGCGYVNDQFLCFRDESCSGAECEQPPVSGGDGDGDGSGGGDSGGGSGGGDSGGGGDGSGTGGGGGFQFDYDRLINGIVGGLTDEAEIPLFADTQELIDGQTEKLDEAYQEFEESKLFDDILEIVEQDIFGSISSILPSGGSCSAYDFAGHSLDLCEVANKIRPLLFFVFSFLTMIYLRNLYFKTVVYKV